MHIDENKKFDRRNIERNIKNGIISRKDYEIYLSRLPDLSDKLVGLEEDLEPKERAPKKKSVKKKPKKKGK